MTLDEALLNLGACPTEVPLWRSEVAVALDHAEMDRLAYLDRRALHLRVERARKVVTSASRGRGQAPANLRRMVHDGSLSRLMAEAEGLIEGSPPSSLPALLKLRADPANTEALASVEHWLEMLVRFTATVQGRRKEAPFFGVLHLGYVYARLTGSRPTATSGRAYRDDADETREQLVFSGPFIDLLNAAGRLPPRRAIADALAEGRYEFDRVLFGAQPTGYRAPGWIGAERGQT